ncbi:MAG: protein translocase subunit SecDF, partial [Flavobacteriaceae bacterium]|nr:protein translocase subunit SecDF [Flavobacteriaceae bacterium]
MQNKGLVKLFALLFGLVSIYQLSFTFKANQIEEAAKQFAVSKISESEDDYDTKRDLEEARYLDSISALDQVYNLGIAKFKYAEVKDKAMNLGLDLKGGINVILQISVKDILSGLANDSKDPVFRKALTDAEELQKNSQNTYLDDFFVAFDAIKGETKLASPDIFANRTLSEEITFNMTDEEVKPILKRKIDESIVSAFEVLRKRIDKFGVTQPNIQRLGNSGRILVELPGAKDVNRVKNLLQSTAQLEFWDVEVSQNLGAFINSVNEALIAQSKSDDTQDETSEEGIDDTEDSEDSQIDALLGETDIDTLDVDADADIAKNFFFSPLDASAIVSVNKIDVEVVKEYLNSDAAKALLPADLKYTKFAFGIEDENNDFVNLYALKGNRDNKPELSGAVITDARQIYDEFSKPAVSMDMNLKGAKIWEEITGRAFNQQTQIAIVLDDIVYSAPGVTTGPISGGSSRITGNYSLNEAQDLANVLRAGKLPASADIVQADEVGPSLGQEAIDTGKKSFVIALILVLIWMLFYYGRAGIFSDIAL